MSDDITDLTVLKMLGKGRGVDFAAKALSLEPKEITAIAREHGAVHKSGGIDAAAAAHAATKLQTHLAQPRIPVRAAPPPTPAPVRAVPDPDDGQVLEQVPLSRLRSDPDNPRVAVGDVTELAASMAEAGLLQPIVARRTPGGQLVVVAGHRRLAAARALKWRTVATVIRADMRPDEVLAAMLIENGHRRDLDPIEEARGLARLQAQAGGCTHAELGRRVGRHQTHVSARLALLALSAEDQAAVRAGAMKLVEATTKARLNAGRVRPARPNAAYFGAGHELAAQAKARCRRLHARVVTMPGGIACGDCWSSVIRADERMSLHERSGATGKCALCDTPTPTSRKANSA